MIQFYNPHPTTYDLGRLARKLWLSFTVREIITLAIECFGDDFINEHELRRSGEDKEMAQVLLKYYPKKLFGYVKYQLLTGDM